ncbi:MAG: DUF6516 family protein [Candidatus Aenigmatarchaeota archaeon]
MMIADYFQEIERLLHSYPLIVSVNIQIEIIDINTGYFKAQVKSVDDPELHLFEFVTIEDNNPAVEKYRYHYQSSQGKLVKRWNNAKHHPEINTFPHHLHDGDKVKESEKPEIYDVLLDS